MDMKKTMLDTPDDMEWLLEVHLPKLAKRFLNGSALLFGNEDLPSKIYIYESNTPLVTDDPLIFILDDETDEYNGTKWD